jgi:hypothetical protein
MHVPFLSKLFTKTGSEITSGAFDLIEKVSAPDQQKQQLKNELSEIITSKLLQLMTLQTQALQTEMQGNWLQRSWRPLVMLTFTVIIVMGVFKEIPYLKDTSPFWELLRLGLGGYVVGRSVEKVADSVTKNIDLPFLKRKDRAKDFDK